MKGRTRMLKGIALLVLAGLLIAGVAWHYKKGTSLIRVNRAYEIGEKLDSYNGIPVYFNDHVENVIGRNLSPYGYNIGLKYQCVEFVKRYYYEKLKHQMPNSYGHAKDFFDAGLEDGSLNAERNLIQYRNGSSLPPREEDLIIFSGNALNPYGHVAIVTRTGEKELEIIQQNPGPYGKSRETYSLEKKNGKWTVGNFRVLGWLRKASGEEEK